MEIKINEEDMNRALAGAKRVQEFLQKEAPELFTVVQADPNDDDASGGESAPTYRHPANGVLPRTATRRTIF
jgi:hypothetical protein